MTKTESHYFLFFQGNRDESYEVDEELAEQDATSLYEVPTQSSYLTCDVIIVMMTNKKNKFIPNDNHV